MKTFYRLGVSGLVLISSLFFMAGAARGQNVPFTVSFYTPTNGMKFSAPANVSLYVRVTDSNVVQTMQYYSSGSLLRTLTNTSGVMLTNTSPTSVFSMVWSNLPAGSYTLTAVGTDAAGLMATSAPVTITLTNPVVRPVCYIYSPTNGTVVVGPTNLMLYARGVENSTGTVATVQFFANNTSLGTVPVSQQGVFTNISIEPLFPLLWPNAPVGTYSLKAVATDAAGMTATSSVVALSIVSNLPPVIVRPAVYIYSPTNGSKFVPPANINIYVHALEGATGTVATVQFFANSLNLGTVANSSQIVVSNLSSVPLFPLTWSNAPAGSYYLKAVATDAVGMTSTSALVSITISNNTPPPPNVPFAISFLYPTNGQSYLAPANIGLRVSVTDSNVVRTVQYFSGATRLGIVTNAGNVVLTNSTQSNNPFYLTWSNVLAGSYALTAVATDSQGNTATSAPPVNITVTNKPAPVIRFAVGFLYPTNGQTFAAPANIGLHAWVTDSNPVTQVQYFSGAALIGTVANTGTVLFTNSTQANPFFLSWSNVPAGSYAVNAVATDNQGNTATSSVVNLTVTNVPPPVIKPSVYLYSPANGSLFLAPATVNISARAYESTGQVASVEFFENNVSLGVVSSPTVVSNASTAPLFSLIWSNVPAGSYALKAVASDTNGQTASSAVANIYVVTNLPPVVTIYAPDPVAVEGTNYPITTVPPSYVTNYVNGTNTATFLVRRDSATNTDLTVWYAITGSAINGVDYAFIPNSVTIPAGTSYALVVIYPLDDLDTDYRPYDNITLTLALPTNSTSLNAPYRIGSPKSAGAIILEDQKIPQPNPVIHAMADTSMHVSLPATNGMNFSLQVSTDLINWQPVCTNTVLKGSAQYVDPSGNGSSGLYYRIVPVATPAAY